MKNRFRFKFNLVSHMFEVSLILYLPNKIDYILKCIWLLIVSVIILARFDSKKIICFGKYDL